jgi:hypothetical protein
MATQTEAASHVSLDVRRFREKVEQGVIPREPDGAYRLDKVRTAYIRHLQNAAGGRLRRPDDPKDRKITAEARLAELQLAIKLGAVANVEDIAEAVQAEYSIVREGILNVPARLAGDLTPDQIDRLEDELRQALEQLHDPDGVVAGLERDRAEAEAASGSKTPAKAKPDRVGRPSPPCGGKDERKPGKMAHKRSARRLRPDARGDGT